jgi:hypothetical protein
MKMDWRIREILKNVQHVSLQLNALMGVMRCTACDATTISAIIAALTSQDSKINIFQ